MNVIKTRLPILLATAALCSSALAQNAGDKPLTEGDLLKQIEALSPAKAGATPSPDAAPAAKLETNPSSGIGDIIKPQANNSAAGDQKDKPPTVITALEATFDNRANVAVFVGDVLVRDPQFNVDCDKLTAYLKHEDKDAAATTATKPATPTPKPATPAPTGTAAAAAGAKKQNSGLDKAIAVTTSADHRVKITQDKVEADGTITHGIGLADRAEYFATTGDIFLYGMPDVTQGLDRCIATAPETWMKLNRDGRMEAHGPHKTIIVDTENSRDANKDANKATAK